MDLSLTQGALCTVSVYFILHFTYLGGGAYAPDAPPAYGPELHQSVRSTGVQTIIFEQCDT